MNSEELVYDPVSYTHLDVYKRQRYGSVEAIARDIQRHRHGRPIEARPPSIGYRLQKYAQRHRLGLVLGSLALLVLLASLGLALRQAQEARREAARAQAMQRLVLGLFDQALSLIHISLPNVTMRSRWASRPIT